MLMFDYLSKMLYNDEQLSSLERKNLEVGSYGSK